MSFLFFSFNLKVMQSYISIQLYIKLTNKLCNKLCTRHRISWLDIPHPCKRRGTRCSSCFSTRWNRVRTLGNSVLQHR